MDRARLQELIQDQLDGDLSAGGRAELARVLLQDAEARRLHDEFLRTDRLLREVPAAELPAGFREAVLAGTARSGQRGGSAGRWTSRSTVRIAAAFLGGLLIVGLVYVARDGRVPGPELQGSLVAAGGTVSLQAEGVAVDATLGSDGDRHRLEIDASAPMPCEVAVTFDPAATSFAGGAGDAVSAAANGEVSVPLPAGRRSVVLEFSGAAPTRSASCRQVESQGYVVGRCSTMRRTERSTHAASLTSRSRSVLTCAPAQAVPCA